MSNNFIDRSNDEEIISIVRSILSNGVFVVETIDESILVELMKKRNTPIENYSSLRDTEMDYKRWLNEKS